MGTGGDLDNRLKTLFDGLRRPISPNEIPAGAAPLDDEKPFHCLLSDDALVSHVNVETRQISGLLEPDEVIVMINASILRRYTVVGTISYIQ